MRGKLLKRRLFAGFILLPAALSGCGGESEKQLGGAGGASGGGAASGGMSNNGGSIELGGAASGGRAAGGAEAGGAVSTAGNAPSGGASGNGGGSAAAGASGNGGSAGGGSSECPAQIPAERASCGQVNACYYSECADRGRVTAICYGHEFTITAVPCDQVTVNCGTTNCAPGQICVEAYSGNVSRTCVDNPCGSHALGCDCAAKLCETGWSCSTQAFSVRCSSPCMMCP